MNDLSTGLILLFPAAVIAAMLYVPAFFILKKKDQGYPAIRHVINYGALLYAGMLVYIVLFLYTDLELAGTVHGLNLVPFREIASAYMSGTGLFLSQYMLNMVMFVPMGLMLPLVFPKAMDRAWKVLLVCFASTFLMETAQYFLGRSADIDDVMANFIGGATGYALYRLICTVLHKTKLRNMLAPDVKKLKVIGIILSLLMLALVFVAPYVFDKIDENNEYGLIPYNSLTIPASAELNIPLDSERNTAWTYTPASEDIDAVAHEAVNNFGITEELEWYTWYSDYYKTSLSARSDDINVTAHEDGTFEASFPDNWGWCALEKDGLLSHAREKAELFLRQGERIADEVYREDGYSCQTEFFFESGDENASTQGSVYFSVVDGTVNVYSSVVRCVKDEQVNIISPHEAYTRSHGMAVYSESWMYGVTVEDVELTVMRVRDKFIPVYRFSGTVLWEGSDEPHEFISYVEAIAR